jgi:hypothetical protein
MKEHRLRVFRRIFRFEMEEVAGGRRKLKKNISSIICTVHKILLGDQIEEDKIGGTCRKHGKDKKCVKNFGRKALKERVYSEDIDVDGNIILQWILREIMFEHVDHIPLDQDRGSWRAFVNTVMNTSVS